MYNVLDQAQADGWALYHGDSVEILQNLPDECIHLSVFSPPFKSLYTFTPTQRDLSNSRNEDNFIEHFEYIVEELFRVTHSGRVCAIHIIDLIATKTSDGYMGLKDFTGDVIRLFESVGWTFNARVAIDKNQEAQAIRTRANSLTMAQMNRDRAAICPALPDYILKFRKPGENKTPVIGGMYGDEWIELANPTWDGDEVLGTVKHAYSQLKGIYKNLTDMVLMQNKMLSSPRVLVDISASAKVIEDLQRRIMMFCGNGNYQKSDDTCADTGSHATWYGIEESNTLQGWRHARDNKDERHVSPTQLQTLERCIRLWSNPGEIILDPFAGIGSTGYVSLLHERKFIGCELKDSYYNAAVNNLKRGQAESQQVDLFDFAGVEIDG